MAVAQTRLRSSYLRCFFQASKSRKIRRLLAASIAALGCLYSSSTVTAQELLSQWSMSHASVDLNSTTDRQTIDMVVNTSRELTASESFKRVRIQNPNVINAIPLEGGNRLQISAVATGITQVDLLGADDSVHSIQIMVLGDVRELEAILQKLFPAAYLAVTPIRQGCVVSGYVNDDEHIEQVMSIAQQYFPTVINKVTVTGVHTIQLETQIMEVSRSKLRALGIDWAFGNGNDAISSTVSGLVTATGTNFASTGTETFKIGVIENSSSFFTAIRALRQNSLVKVLASPTLTAVDGRPASFNAGGEIPIVVPAGLGQVGVQYREFGTRLDYVAKVKSNGKIWLEVRPYVSEIDPSQSVSIQGISVPGLRSRFLETGVELGAGQTLALGGLLQMKNETISRGLPGLSDMPYVGALFRSTSEQQNEVELLITVTPNFAGPLDPCEVPPMGLGTASQPPTDKELFWRGYIETPAGGTGGESCGLIESIPQSYGGGTPYTEQAAPIGVQPGGAEFVPPTPATMPSAANSGLNSPRLAGEYHTQTGQGQRSASTPFTPIVR